MGGTKDVCVCVGPRGGPWVDGGCGQWGWGRALSSSTLAACLPACLPGWLAGCTLAGMERASSHTELACSFCGLHPSVLQALLQPAEVQALLDSPHPPLMALQVGACTEVLLGGTLSQR